MNWFTGVLVYIIIWFVTLFAVLPFGVRVPEKTEPGHATSAPEKPRMWLKVGITSAVALVIWGIVYYVIDRNLIPVRDS